MKQIHKIAALLLGIVLSVSCDKNEVAYNTTPVGNGAEYQLHYFVPVEAVAANNIYKIEVNGQLLSNQTAVLTTYNAVPNGGVGRFYTVAPGQVNIKLYQGTSLKPVYDQTCTLKEGKQNIFVYDFSKPPIVFDNGYPYTAEITERTSSTAWIKFYNFLFEKAGEPTGLKLQYQYQYTTDNAKKTKSEWINIGKPVAFGETTGWQPVVVNKTVELSAGTARLDYRIKIIEPNGTDTALLQVNTSKDKYAAYTGYTNANIGRRYHQVLSGLRTDSPRASVRQFTAL